ncbi:gamma-glutamyltransferase [Tautonia sp. JC769]|uniref:gamma-glutamyltransferase n=1 Tax=Tautonia sp. JC769 TaxID=3232135 RepID=UPI003457915A
MNRLPLPALLLVATMTNLAHAHDRPTGPIHKSRSAVLARHGMAASSQPLAVQAAIRVLQEGGNAIDAAIAANAVIGVVEPMSCGIGGDLFAIVWDAKSGKLHGLNASGRAPGRASIELYRSQGHEYVPVYGPLSWSVPGCVDGWATLHERFGSVPFADLLAPAIRYAEGGFPISEVIAANWKDDEARLAEVTSSAECLLPGGKAPGFGDVFRNPDLARTLRVIAEEGAAAFYRGGPAKAIVAYSDEVGGLFTLDDFASHESTWVDPVSTNYRGYDVWELPPNGQGIAALQMLNILEPFDLASLGHNTAETLHLMIEAKKLAFEDRATYYADPAFAEVPVDRLISKAYAEGRAALIDPERAMTELEPGPMQQGDTIYLTVVDKDFNCVSLIQSNFHSFGSQHVVRGLGFPLQNRGSWFALDPSHANRLEPGKRPFHTIIPAFVTKDGKPWLSFGVMGGDMQPQGHVQVLCNMIDFGMDVQEAGEAARFRHFGSSEPTGQPGEGGGAVSLESGIGPEVREALEAKGHRIDDRPGSYGGYQAIRIDLERGVLQGGSDPRKDGAAIGY